MNNACADPVGQSLMLHFTGRQATHDVLEAIAYARPCGVILFSGNIGTPAELYELVRTLQTYAAAIGLPPLLIAIDQEGGTVTRFPLPFITVPSQMAQAATGDPNAATRCAAITAQQLRAFGINTNFAPVLDINCNPDNPVIGTRAFGETPDVVTRFGMEALNGYLEGGVVATIKHFPGHGDTNIDSHLALPTISCSADQFEKRELMPFAAAIQAGAPALMTAHILFRSLDDQPATISRAILTDLLRDKLGFNGLIFTDSLSMQAIAERYTPAEAGLRAKIAGADILLPLGSLDQQLAVAETLCDALASGTVPIEVFQSTSARLDRLRARYGLSHTLPPFTEPAGIWREEALAIARRSITLLHNDGILPLEHTTQLVLLDCMVPRFSLVEEEHERAKLLRELVRRLFPHTRATALSQELSETEVAQAMALAGSGEVILLVTRNAFLLDQQVQLARRLTDLGKPWVHVAARSPYDAAVISGSAATLLTYGDPPLSLQALVEVLARTTYAQGRLPISLSHTRFQRKEVH